jgi:LPS export ABC transporter protein LptC
MQHRKHSYFNTITRKLFPGILFCVVCSCKNDPADIRALTTKSSTREDRFTKVTAVYSQDGKVTMRLFAKEGVRSSHGQRPYIDLNGDLKVEFYDDSGRVEHLLTADSSRYYEAQGDVIIWDSVQIVTKKGEQLNTSELIWNQAAQKFFTEKPVKITTPREVLYGNGMEANRDFSWYQITNPKGTVQVDKGEMPQ